MEPAESVAGLEAAAREAYFAGDVAGAIALLRRALAAGPARVEVLNNLGLMLGQAGASAEAEGAFRRAIEVGPPRAEPWANLANLLRARGDLTGAVECYQRALDADANNAGAMNNLAATLFDMGEVRDAVEWSRRAVAAAPTSSVVHSNLLYSLHFDPRSTADSLRREHEGWAAKFEAPVTPLPPSTWGGRPAPLRVGYVSADLDTHAVARFLLPILEGHDRGRFDVFVYSAMRRPEDAMTRRLRSAADGWRSIAHLGDDDAARLIRADGVHVLVDLSAHLAENRLPVFARRPAPVQVTYLAYPSTTGLRAMGYRLTDPHLDPAAADGDYVERSVRLPETYWCYRPVAEAGDVPERPANRPVTFGCLNNFRKVNDEVLEAWARVLARVEDSRLIVHSLEGPHRERVWRLFESHGLARERVRFAGAMSLAAYFRTYAEIDLALDTFPYAGGTTTCDAAYMGVPTVTLAGQTAVGRGGGSINANLGLADLVAADVAGYVAIAVRLGRDRARLRELRGGLRERMRRSALMDEPRFVRGLESAYDAMWAEISG